MRHRFNHRSDRRPRLKGRCSISEAELSPMIRISRNRWVTLTAIILAVGAVTAWYFTPASAKTDDAVVARVKKGDFKVVVTSAGELRAKKFVQVQGPLNMQQADIYQTKISSLVPEGTVVKEGDVVAELTAP